jgi:hypothetical protein
MSRGTWQGSGTWQTSGLDLGAATGPAVLVVIAAAAVTVIAQIIVWLAVITGILVLAGAAVLVLVWRHTKRREAAYEASPQHQQLIGAKVTPQVSQGTPAPSIVNNYYIRIDPADREAARIIRTALPGMAGDIITEE